MYLFASLILLSSCFDSILYLLVELEFAQGYRFRGIKCFLNQVCHLSSTCSAQINSVIRSVLILVNQMCINVKWLFTVPIIKICLASS